MVVLTKHAEIRMRERGISKKEMEDVISASDRIEKADDKFIAQKRIGSSRIAVVFVKEKEKLIVITCYKL